MSKTMMEEKKPARYYAVIILIFVLLVCAALLLLHAWEKEQGSFPTEEVDTLSDILEYEGKEYRLNDDITTFLVVGLDPEDDEQSKQRADFALLFVMDDKKQTCRAIQINRDTIVNVNKLDISGTKVLEQRKEQLALAHTYGYTDIMSVRNVADSVSDLLGGAKIDYYASVGMDAVPILNDMVGGVEVLVTDDFTGIDDSLVLHETVKLTGKQALTFVRSRQGLEDSSNERRMIRQKVYLDGLYRQVTEKTATDAGFAINAVTRLEDHFTSNASVTLLQSFAEKLSTYNMMGIDSIEGQTMEGTQFIEFYPYEDKLMAKIVQLFYLPKE